MKYYIYTIFLLLLAASCSDDVQKWDNWPEWKLASPLSVGGNVLDEEIYSNFQGKKLHLEKGQEIEFSVALTWLTSEKYPPAFTSQSHPIR